MDFHATRDRPDFTFGPLKQGEFTTRKLFVLYTLRDGKVAQLHVDWQEVATRTEFDMVCERFRRTASPRGSSIRASSSTRTASCRHGRGDRSRLPSPADERDARARGRGEAARRSVQSARRVRREQLPRQAPRQEDALRAAPRSARHRAYTPEEAQRAAVHPVDAASRRGEDRRAGRHDDRSRPLGPRQPQPSGAQTERRTRWSRRRSSAPTSKARVGAGAKLALVDPSVVQRRVPLPSAMFPEVGAAGELFFSRRYIELDPILFRGEMRGLWTVSPRRTEQRERGRGTVPDFIIEHGFSAA